LPITGLTTGRSAVGGGEGTGTDPASSLVVMGPATGTGAEVDGAAS
jgi:hypothetical protein